MQMRRAAFDSIGQQVVNFRLAHAVQVIEHKEHRLRDSVERDEQLLQGLAQQVTVDQGRNLTCCGWNERRQRSGDAGQEVSRLIIVCIERQPERVILTGCPLFRRRLLKQLCRQCGFAVAGRCSDHGQPMLAPCSQTRQQKRAHQQTAGQHRRRQLGGKHRQLGGRCSCCRLA